MARKKKSETTAKKAAAAEKHENPQVQDSAEARPPAENEETTPAEELETTEAAAENAEAAGDEASVPADDLETQLAEARQEAARNLENWQRAAAELANFKRRQEEQMKLQRDRIKSDVLQGVISALDDLDLAFQNLPEELDGQLVGWVEGFRLVQRKLHKILDEQNVMPISTDGKFDPNFHEAVSYEPHNDHDTDDIIAELRKGYQIGNRVIRPALVRVAQ
ncbi:MAG: nucleotide exchange factor GrpE [Chloroflexi bacterium]|nr:MAG: nucleotide exchange factor GrpE [Chloroflexota bacterium]